MLPYDFDPDRGENRLSAPTVLADVATEWLRGYLEEHGPTPAPQLLQAALAVGITQGTLAKAKKRIAVSERIQAFQSGTMIRLPEQDTPEGCIPKTEKTEKRTKKSVSSPKVVAVADTMPMVPDTETPVTEELLRETARQTTRELSGALEGARSTPVLVQVDHDAKVVHVFVAPGWHFVAHDMIPT